VWPTEAFVGILIGESEQMVRLGVIEEPLTVDQVRTAFEPTIPVLKAAYEATDSYPAAEVFTDPEAEDLRGKPIWDVNWSDWEDFTVEK
jgi:hypothetical protein